MPECDGRTKEGKALRATFAVESGGKTIVTTEQYERARRMAEALRENQIAGAILSNPARIVETPLRWSYESGNLTMMLKAKPDLFLPASGDNFPLCVDLKTTADPSPEAFARQAQSLGYHHQAAYYVDGCQRCYTGGQPVQFLILAVANDEPWDVWPYLLGQDWVGDGAEENWIALNRLAACYQSGDWRDPAQATLTQLERPRWARRKDFDL
jgi:hypothetical protein